jgi:hypothetical protein
MIELRLPDSERRLQPIAFDGMVRLGRDNDGGYVLPEILIDEADCLLSFGIYNDWSFEHDFQRRRPALPIHCYDHSISGRRFKREAWIETLRVAARRTSMDKARSRWSTARSYERFFKGVVRHFARKITNRPINDLECDLTSALDKIGGKKVLLKMDIEGAEYRMIDQLGVNADRIIGACIEFHDIEPLRAVFDRAIDTLLGKFVIAHVHANNYGQVADDGLPDALEITFVGRTRAQERKPRPTIYIAGLDQPNDASRPELVLQCR